MKPALLREVKVRPANAKICGAVRQSACDHVLKATMKSKPQKTTPKGSFQAGQVNEKNKRAEKSAAHTSDPGHRFHAPAQGHDRRTDAVAGLAPQRLRARQSEAR